MKKDLDDIFRLASKVVFLLVGVVVLLWFLAQIIGIILLIVLAAVLILIINRPVSLLEKKKLRRGWACFIVFVAIFTVIIGIAWLIGPLVSEQLSELIKNLPNYIDNLTVTIHGWFRKNLDVDEQVISDTTDLNNWIPSVSDTFLQVSAFSLSMLGGIVVFIVFVSIVIYGVANPAPLVKLYLSLFPGVQRQRATAALKETSVMLVGWIKSNLIAGSIEAVLVSAFLSFMNVPGAFVWGALAFFSELIPKIGFYLMSIPPILVSLSIDGYTALWVTVFFLVLNEIMGNIIIPKLRSSTMNIHPVSTLVMLLIMGSTFGIVGALIATPLCAIIKAHFEEFYGKKQIEEKKLDDYVTEVLK